jgi:hypothetical protein
MSDSGPLIVPVEVQAMVLNSTNVNFMRATMSYGNLEDFGSPSPGPFKRDEPNFAGSVKNHGVYLRWVLPNALRHGTANDKNEIEFPLVPDRWLVTRLHRPAGSKAAPEIKAWVVQSNYAPQGNSSPKGTTAFLDSATAKQLRIGRKVEVTTNAPWKEPGAKTGVPLRAVAEGNPAFATYQPFNKDVFSIHDDLVTQKVAAGTLSYYVVGWYSDPAKDILAGWQLGADGKGFRKRLKELKWSASAAGQGARATVYQGMVFSVVWEPGGQPPPSPKDGAKPQVAIGNTSVDGVVAFAKAAVEAHPVKGFPPQQAADLLEAFQYNLLPMLGEYGAEEMLEQKIRGHWYGSAQGGARWVIVDAEVAQGATRPKPPSAEEQARQTKLLASLNADQAALDEASRELMGMQRRLYELWFKKGLVEVGDQIDQPLPWGIDSTEQIEHAVEVLAADAQKLKTKRDGLAKRVTTGLAALSLPAARVVKQVAAPRFWSSADPVVVVSNTAHTIKLAPDDELPCRWPSEVLPSSIAKHEPAMTWAGLPAEARPLFSECFVLDPANASLLSGSNTSGAAAIKPAFVPPPWKQQPWQPLYLDWEIEWYPIPLAQSDGARKPNWKFNGLDYEFVPGMTAPEGTLLQGRSVLTPKPSFELKARLDQFIKENKGTEAARQLEAVKGVVQAVEGWDFLRQTLSGLSTLIAGWRPDPAQNPEPKIAALIEDVASGPPNPQLYETSRHPAVSRFEGMRGGQFFISRLTVVDVFGQTLEIVTTDESKHFLPLIADGLLPKSAVNSGVDIRRLVELPPRLLQPARLNFQFDAVKNDNPILGWILPNHLDASVAVYGAGGKQYGELSRSQKPTDKPDWKPAPGAPYETLSKLAAGEPQLGGLVLSLQQAGAQAFAEFLEAVDETLWTVDVTGHSNDTFLATLVGRPVAVVVAKLNLELQSQAWTDTEWPFTFATPRPRPPFLDFKFPVRLGDLGYRQDGLIGYFVGGVYTKFNTVHRPEKPATSGYVVPLAPGNYIDLAFAPQGSGDPAALTLIMDPRVSVHAQCALFPVKEVTLAPRWVDDALAAMEATFRTGPVLAATEQVVPKGQTKAETTLLLPTPAERRGSWSWVEGDGKGNWPESPLAPVSDAATFPDTPPALREGLLKLKGGLGK